MSIVSSISIKRAESYDRAKIISLLKDEGLPFEDLPLKLENFYAAWSDGCLAGVIGLEIYGQYGLLRSLAVAKDHRNKGIASVLVQSLEEKCASTGIEEIYLLTETAPHYFERKSYKRTSRNNVPSKLLDSSEFSHVCPVSAIVMYKQLLTQ